MLLIKFKSAKDKRAYEQAFKRYLLRRNLIRLKNEFYYAIENMVQFAISMNVHSQRDKNTLKRYAEPVKALKQQIKREEAKLNKLSKKI